MGDVVTEIMCGEMGKLRDGMEAARTAMRAATVRVTELTAERDQLRQLLTELHDAALMVEIVVHGYAGRDPAQNLSRCIRRAHEFLVQE